MYVKICYGKRSNSFTSRCIQYTLYVGTENTVSSKEFQSARREKAHHVWKRRMSGVKCKTVSERLARSVREEEKNGRYLSLGHSPSSRPRKLFAFAYDSPRKPQRATSLLEYGSAFVPQRCATSHMLSNTERVSH